MVKSQKGGSKDAKHEALNLLMQQIEMGDNSHGVVAKAGMTKAQLKSEMEKVVAQRVAEEARRVQVPYSDEELQAAFLMQKEAERRAFAAAQYVNVPMKLHETSWHEAQPNRYVRYEQFDSSDVQMQFIVDLFKQELSEPYSSFTYNFFVFGCVDLTIIAFGVDSETVPDSTVKGTMMGAIVSRVSRKGPGHPLRGYVAMLAVLPSYRGMKIGSKLIILSVGLMRQKECDVVYLETPTANERALKIYTDLGFAKTKYLPRYYLEGADAVRLKLWLRPFVLPGVEMSMNSNFV